MNVDKSSAAKTDAPLAPPEWTMDMQLEGSRFTAEIKRAGKAVCRLSAFGSTSDEPAVRRELADKARWWIQEYLSRNR